MPSELYTELKCIGISDELAHSVDKSLAPGHVATKSDLLVMQEAMLQTQLHSEKRHYELSSKIDRIDNSLSSKIDRIDSSLNSKIDRVSSDLRVEIAAISRQFWITFGGLITTIMSVFLVNWYFH